MMNLMKWFGPLFAAAGAILLTVATVMYFVDRDFAARGLRAEGQVSGLVEKRSDDGSSYSPAVIFIDNNGQKHEFVEGISSSPPRYTTGERVTVIYDPANPESATIDDFFNRFLLPFAIGVFGLTFGAVGLGIILFMRIKAARKAYLLRHGRPLQADFLHVYLDKSLSVNGANPYRVVAQARDPASGELRRYESDRLWVDPTKELTGKTVTVLVHPQKPERHTIDLRAYGA